MNESPSHRYAVEDLGKLNCFSRFLYSLCVKMIEKIYDAVASFIPKNRKAEYDCIMENIVDELKNDNISHDDAVKTSKAVRLFISLIDGIIAVLASFAIVAGIIIYFKFGG